MKIPFADSAAARFLAAVDARFRDQPPEHEQPAGSLRATWRDAGAWRWLLLFQLGLFWSAVAFSPLLAFDNDLFFHLAHGRHQEATGRVPTDSYFSFLEPRVYLDYYWLYQRLVFQVWQAAGGAVGLMVLRAALATVALGLLAHFLFARRRAGSSLLAASLVFAVVGSRLVEALQYSRPFVFSYLCLLAMLWILERRPRWLPLLPVVGVAWINFHGVEHPVMIAVLLAYAGDAVLRWARRGELTPAARRRFKWILLTFPTLLLSPHGWALVPFPFKSTALASLYVVEMKKPALEDLVTVGFGPGIEQPLFTGAAVILLLGLGAAGRALERRRLQPVHLVLFLTGVWLVFQGYRFTVELALLALPLLSEGFFAERRGFRPAFATLMVAAVCGLFCYQVGEGWIAASRGAYPLAFERFPQGTASFLARVAPPGGRILNAPGPGGFLLWELGDRHRLTMDFELQALFTDEDYLLTSAALSDPAAFRSFAARYRPDWIAVDHDRGQKAAAFLRQTENFVPVSFDDELVLLVDRLQHPELAEQWQLSALDPARALLDPAYRLTPQAEAEAARLYAVEKRGLRLPVLLAQAAIARGDRAAAREYVGTLMEVSPDNADTWHLASMLALRDGDLDGGREALEKAIRRAEKKQRPALRLALAQVLAKLGDRRGALAELRAVGDFFVWTSTDDLRLYAELAGELGSPQEAAAAARAFSLRSGRPIE